MISIVLSHATMFFVHNQYIPVAWCIGIVSGSRNKSASYSENVPPTNTPTSLPTTSCFGIPALSSASKVHSSNKRCCGSRLVASCWVNPKKGASKAFRSCVRKLPPRALVVPLLPGFGWKKRFEENRSGGIAENPVRERARSSRTHQVCSHCQEIGMTCQQ